MEFNEKQLQIMDSALAVFAEKGYSSASVRDIAQKADVNVAMISYYFGSKEKLLEALFRNHTANMKGKIESILQAKSADPFEKVDLLIDTYIDVIVNNRNFHRLMVREQALSKDGPLYQYIRDMKLRNKKLIEAAIKSGQKMGIFQKHIDATMLSITLVGSVNMTFLNYKFLCQEYKIKENDEDGFYATILQRLRNHLKTMFKSFLTYGISNS